MLFVKILLILSGASLPRLHRGGLATPNGSKFTNLKCFFLVLSFLLIVPLTHYPVSLIWAAIYYVDATTGNDTNQGTLKNTPLKTIQKAADKSAPGDTCLVRSGSYNERIHITRSGALANPLFIKPKALWLHKVSGLQQTTSKS